MGRRLGIRAGIVVTIYAVALFNGSLSADQSAQKKARRLVRRDGVAIRSTPEANGTVVRRLFAAEPIVAITENDGWVRIHDGWIKKDAIVDPLLAIEEFSRIIDQQPTGLAFVCRSRAHLELRHIEEGLADAGRAVAIASDYAPAWHLRGWARELIGELDAAETDAREAIRLAPTWGAAYSNLGFVLFRKRSYPEAIVAFTKAATQGWGDACTFNNRGACYSRLGQTSKAIADFTRAIEINSNFREAYKNRAQMYCVLGRWNEALSDIDRAVEVGGASPDMIVVRANIKREEGRDDEALDDFTRALELDPKLSYALVSRAILYLKQARFKEAIVDSSRALEITPRYPEALGIRGAAHAGTGELETALEDLTQALIIEPNGGHLYSTRGLILTGLCEYARALKDFEDAVRLSPDDALAHRGYGWLLATCPDAAVRDAKKALAEATRACEITDYQDGQSVEGLAAACAESGDFGAAKQYIELAVRLAPKDAELQRRAAVARELYRESQPYRENRTSSPLNQPVEIDRYEKRR